MVVIKLVSAPLLGVLQGKRKALYHDRSHALTKAYDFW